MSRHRHVTPVLGPGQSGNCYPSAAGLPDHPLVPEDPARLSGPEVGALCRYVSRSYPDGMTVRVAERSYVWSPEKHWPDGTHGYRHYDWSVIEHGDRWQHRIVVNDTDLTPIE